jgi:hypothetical protein
MFKIYLRRFGIFLLMCATASAFSQTSPTNPQDPKAPAKPPMTPTEFKKEVTTKGEANKTKLYQQVASLIAAKGPTSNASRPSGSQGGPAPTPTAPAPIVNAPVQPSPSDSSTSTAPQNYTGYQDTGSGTSSGSQPNSGLNIQY